jgi:cytochrome c2
MEKAVLRRLTSLCIICGVAGLALLGLTAIRDEKREWKHFQAEYKEQLLKKIGREKNAVLYDRTAAMQPEVKQLVIDDFKAVDRCVTCHLGIEDPSFADAKQPLKSHPYPELLKKHPVEKYGCTICHGGQGLATTYEGASHKTIADWAAPMVSKGLMQSRCGVCHKDFEAIGADRLIKGRALFKEMHCAGCHQIERQGGAVGPDLSAFADKDPGNFAYAGLEPANRSKQGWVMEHFKDPKKVSPGSAMRTYAMNDYQLECLSSYVLSLSQRNFPRQLTPKPRAGFVPVKVDAMVPEAKLFASGEDEDSE